MVRLVSILGLGLLVAAGATAEPARAPVLGAAANFGQTWHPDMLAAATRAGIATLRDELHWDFAERDGAYVFGDPILAYPDALAARDMALTLITGGGHPAHDGGVTPYSPAAVAAYAAFFATAAARFPAVDAVEVGNEMNSEDFTAGPAHDADIAGRAHYYAALLRATHDAVRAARPDARILGGAAHSIPLAWFDTLSREGAAAWMDAIALHPYTTPPEQFRRQVALLRAVPGFETLPIEVTELGTPDAAAAPALLVKSFCQMPLAGVTRLTWYPLSPRGDGFEPLLAADGSLTATGRTWAFLSETLSGLPVTDVAPDPFTYACQFGDAALVIWGAPRDVRLDDPALTAHDASGAPVAAPRLSRDTPLVVLTTGPAPRLGDTVRLGPQAVIADSFDQFAYPGQPGDGFDRFARVGDARVPFALGPGQQVGGVPWTPHLWTDRDGTLRMDAGFLLPSMWDGTPAEIIHAFEAPEAMVVAVEAMVAPTSETTDGVVLTLRLNGAPLAEMTIPERTELTEPRIPLAAGDRLELVLGPGASAEGDSSTYRFTLRRAE